MIKAKILDGIVGVGDLVRYNDGKYKNDLKNKSVKIVKLSHYEG